jgi:hypothetical protein
LPLSRSLLGQYFLHHFIRDYEASFSKNIFLTDRTEVRNVLYDYYYPRGDNRSYQKELKEIIKFVVSNI